MDFKRALVSLQKGTYKKAKEASPPSPLSFREGGVDSVFPLPSLPQPLSEPTVTDQREVMERKVDSEFSL